MAERQCLPELRRARRDHGPRRYGGHDETVVSSRWRHSAIDERETDERRVAALRETLCRYAEAARERDRAASPADRTIVVTLCLPGGGALAFLAGLAWAAEIQAMLQGGLSEARQRFRAYWAELPRRPA